MELYIKVLADYYAKHGCLERQADPVEIVRERCYQTLDRIRAVLEDETLDDPECFRRIEEIVCAFEELGVGVEYRHDYG